MTNKKRKTKKKRNKTKHKINLNMMHRTKHNTNYKKRTYKIVGGMFNGILSGNGLNVGKFSEAMTQGSKALGIHSSQQTQSHVGVSNGSTPSIFSFQTSKSDPKKDSKEGAGAGPIGDKMKNLTIPGGLAIPTLPGGMAIPGGKMPTLPGGMAIPGGKMPTLPGGLAIPGVKIPTLPGGMALPNLTTGVNGLTSKLTKGLMSDPKLGLKGMPQLKMSTGALSKGALAKGGLAKGILAEQSNGLLSTLKIFKAYPMGSLLIETIAKSYENVMLFKHIFKSKELRNNKYKRQMDELTPEQKKDFDIACCLIKKYYIKDIAKNYSYFRETDYITENCKVIKYIQSQIKLFNSTITKMPKHFSMVFNNNITKFADIQNNIGTKTLTEMQEEIEKAFTIENNNYSYIILFLLHDIINGKIITSPDCEYTHEEESCELEEGINAIIN
jgi:hypothetical protein